MNNNSKYLKYKNKYLQLKNNLLGGLGGTNTLYITIGVPGSGKTTRCEKASRSVWGEKFEADEFPGLYEGGFKPRLLPQAHAWCKDNVRQAMERKVEDIYQSNTNLNPRDMIEYLQFAKTHSYKVKILIPEKDNLLHYSTTLPYESQVRHVKSVRSGAVEDQKIIPEQAMNGMIVTFEQIIETIRKIKVELETTDMENNPEAWIQQINIEFPRKR